MPRSTIAVGFVAVFLLGLLVGSRWEARSAQADATPVSGNGTVFLATGQWSDTATLWEVVGDRVVRATHYERGGANATEPLAVTSLFIPAAAPPTPQRPK